MTDSDQAGSGQARDAQAADAQAGSERAGEEPETPQAAGDAQAARDEPAADEPGYLTQTGEAVGEDGSVVPIIGGLPAAEGSAWDIGAPRDERGAELAEELGDSRADEGDHEDPPAG